MRLLIKIFLLNFICIQPVLAQKYIHYTAKDGLPSNMVYRISQDKQGFIWLITDKGIARFDGTSFKRYSTREGLPINDIWDMKLTDDNKLWYFSKSSSLGYIQNDSIHVFPAVNKDTNLFPSIIYETGNEIYFGYNTQYFYLKNGVWQELPEMEDDLADSRIAAFKAGRKKINHFTSQNRTTYGGSVIRGIDSLGLILGKNGYAVVDLINDEVKEFEYPDGIKTKDHGLFRFHKVNGQIQLTGPGFVSELTPNSGITNLRTYPDHLNSHFAMTDRSGSVWFASLTDGIYMLPKRNKNISFWLEDKKIKQLKLTPAGILISVYNDGFYLFNSNKVELLQTVDDFVYGSEFIEELNTLYLLSSKGISAIGPDNRRKTYSAVARRLIYHEGSLYGNVSAGLNKIDPKSMKVEFSIPQVGIKSLAKVNDKLFVGTSGGLKVLNGKELNLVAFQNEPFDKPILNITPISDDRLIIGTDGFGVFITDMNAARLLPETKFLSARDIHATNESLWLATEEGILQYQINNNELLFKEKYDNSFGIYGQNTNSVLVDEASLFVGSDDGLIVLPKNAERGVDVLAIYIESSFYKGEQIKPGNTGFSFKKNGTLVVHLGMINFSQSTNTPEYEYRLQPGQPEWTTTSSKTLNFSALSPGTYHLKLRQGNYEKDYSYTIKPLWWQNPWSKALFIVAGIGVLMVILFQIRRYEINRNISRIEIQKKLTEFELYALRSQMNPHFVFNSLAAIQYCINNNEIQMAESYLVKFSRLVRQFFEISKLKKVPVSQEVKLLENYLDIEKLRFKEKLDYSIRIEPGLENGSVMIPTMLLQPIVENAINHGIFNKEMGGRVDICFYRTAEGSLRVDIADDGVGFVRTSKNKRNRRTSSDVLNDRLLFLNKSGEWIISSSHKEAFPHQADKGNITTFIIQPLP